jgi:uncharacterized protein (DUF1330 family)
MPAYVVASIEISDEAAYGEYRVPAAASVAAYDGIYLARGPVGDRLEGEWPFSRLVVMEFPTRERALEWWHSPEYAAAKELRAGAAEVRIVVIDGYAPS